MVASPSGGRVRSSSRCRFFGFLALGLIAVQPAIYYYRTRFRLFSASVFFESSHYNTTLGVVVHHLQEAIYANNSNKTTTDGFNETASSFVRVNNTNTIDLKKVKGGRANQKQTANATVDKKSHDDEKAIIETTRSDTIKEVIPGAASAAGASVAVFYHIFVPPTVEGTQNAVRIVREQVGQIQDSYAARSTAEEGHNLTVFFTTLGNRTDIVNTTSLKEMLKKKGPSNIVFEHIHHAESGREILTLQRMHKFCSSKAATHSVVYLHNKGSFHQHEWNENWRPVLTYAALSKMCLHESACNLCALQFFTAWMLFVPGNMFAAKCDYVSKLIAPVEFPERLEKAMAEVALLRLTGNLAFTLLHTRGEFHHENGLFFGPGRYADEHWIGSHPDIKPCDCDPQGNYTKFLAWPTPDIEPALNWGMGPRTRKAVFPYVNEDLVWDNRPVRLREYYLFAGNLVKWYSLYGRGPPSDSWAWKFWPDGQDVWKKAVRMFGAQAVQQVTSAAMSPAQKCLAAPERAFSSTKKPSEFKKVPVAVFYDIFVPSNMSDTGREQNLIRQQLSILAKSPATSSAPIYFNTAGNSGVKEVVTDAGCKNCRRLDPHSKQRFLGDTLRHLYAYCRSDNGDSRVIYLRNHIVTDSDAPAADDEALLRRYLVIHATRAVTGAPCVNAVKKDTCNVCGLLFDTLPALMMQGNIWVADCSYINRLLHPAMFVGRLREAILQLLVWTLRARIKYGLFEQSTPYGMGLGGFSMEHWVGSHPSLLPCDVVVEQDLAMGRNVSVVAGMQEKQQRPKSTRRSSSYGYYDAVAESTVRQSESLRMREGTFLAGNLYKWYTLYGHIPSNSSWVWSFFPDGRTWMLWTDALGNHTVEHLTNFYAEQAVKSVQKVVQEVTNKKGDVSTEGILAVQKAAREANGGIGR